MAVFPIEKTPLTISGCRAWLDAADLDTITSSGGFASIVRNKADSSRPFTQVTGANQPRTGVNTIAGKNVLTFDGSNDSLNVPQTIPAPQTSGYTIFIVAQSSIPVTTNTGIVGSDGTNRAYLRLSPSAGAVSFMGTSPSTGVIITGNTSSPFGAILRFDPSVTTGYLTLNTDNAILTSPNYSGALGVQTIGTQATSPNPFFTGYVAEFLTYNRPLSAEEILKINRYLSNKWGVNL